MNSISVRQAVLADLDELTQLFDQYRQFQGQESNFAAARDFLRARFNHNESVIFIAHDGKLPVGFAQLYPSFSSVALARVFVLNDLFVHESGRRKGVASKLLAALEAYAAALGAVRITLLVAKPNISAQALYASRGWQQDEQFFMYHCYPQNE